MIDAIHITFCEKACILNFTKISAQLNFFRDRFHYFVIDVNNVELDGELILTFFKHSENFLLSLHNFPKVPKLIGFSYRYHTYSYYFYYI